MAGKFIMLRGAPASGKSTWIEDHGLEGIAVSADDWRIRLLGIATDEDGHSFIPQHSQRLVWQNVRYDIEQRIANDGDVVLDACSLRTSEMAEYIDMCAGAGYEGHVIEFFHDIDRETAHERNHGRGDPKQVPDRAIDKFYDNVDNFDVPDFYNVIPHIDGAYEEIFADREPWGRDYMM